MTAPARFTQAELARVMKAVKQSGHVSARVILDVRGRIEILLNDRATAAETDDEEWQP